MSSVRTFATSTIGDALTPLGPPEVATEFVTRTAASRVRAIHPSLFDVDAQGVPVSTARAFATHSSIPTESTVFTPADVEVLPDLPAWVFGFLAGCAAFISIVASALLLAQFRPQMRCAVRIGRWIRGKGRGSGYRKIEQEDYQLDDIYRSGHDGALHGRDHGSDGLKNRKGHSKHLSISTRLHYAGLGIAVQGYRNVDPGEQPRQSIEELHSFASPTGVAVARRGSLTAPLPSTKHFALPVRRPSSAFEASTALEDGWSGTPGISVSTPEIFNYDSPVHQSVRSPRYTTTSGTVMLERITGGVAGAADKMAKRFYDHVNPNDGPEQGLWLPVRDSEREVKGLSGVLVG